MNIRTILSIGVLVSTLMVQGVNAAEPTATESNKIRDVLKQHFPEFKVDQITSSPLKGLYQVTAGGTVLYMTGDGRYAVSGDIIDLDHGQKDITEDFRKQARVKAINAIGEENMIIFAPKNPKYTVTVFTDVDCGYCRKLQTDMPKINELGIAVRYLAFPRSGPNTPTFDKMVKVWCASDKKQALIMANQDKAAEGKACDSNPIMNELQLGMSLGVSGTPTLIFADGTMIPGYVPPDKMLKVAQQLANPNAPAKTAQ